MVFFDKIKRNMGFIVKNTTDLNVLDLICPHTCRGCGRLGELLCGCCKNNIEKANLQLRNGKVFVYGARKGLLYELVKEYKYAPVRGMGRVFARMMDEILPEFSGEVAIVPLPTIARHVRERGFDHMVLLAKKLAKMRGYQMVKMLSRANNAVQVGADEALRRKQAKTAYEVAKPVSKDATYILVDDVWTTGASMRAAIKLLREAGAQKVYGAVIVANK